MYRVKYGSDIPGVDVVCDGPNVRGFCPRVAPGERILCASREIVFSVGSLLPTTPPGDRRFRFSVSQSADMCPLACLGV